MTRIHEFIGAAFGLGSHSQMTANAPGILRRAGVIQRLQQTDKQIVDGGDVCIEPSFEIKNPKLKYLKDVTTFAKRFSVRVHESLALGYLPVVIGGDHTVSIGSIAAAKSALGDQDLGLLWVDAHPDINTSETTPSGNIHGMGVAISLGQGESCLTQLMKICPKVKPQHLAYVGLRDVDLGEKQMLKDLGIKTFTMSDIDAYGIGVVMDQALKIVNAGTSGFLASFDLDVCDPSVAPGVGTPVRGGLTYREAHYIMERIAAEPKLLVAELVEFNPAMDASGSTCEFTISLLQSVVGKSIL